ncbi:hypothetical protein [Streptomyces sp. WMMC905]|uniref:hypothetical protein n=1 Tax=Streptomyces sp. WMMC905 TaxID=3404123 RepID=UPI003B92B395
MRREGFSPLSSHLRAHRSPRALAWVVVCALALVIWGGESVLFPNISGEDPVRASGAAFVPLLLGIGVLISAGDSMADFSRGAALPRRHVLPLHLAGAFLVALLVTCAALVGSGAFDALPPAVRNLLGFTGLAAVSAASLGTRSAWVLPLAQTVPAFLLGSPGPDGTAARWWEWPRAAADSGASWALAVALALVGAVLVIVGKPRAL